MPRRIVATQLFLVGFLIFIPDENANAHVKWFAPFDLHAAPRDLREVLSDEFWLLNFYAILALWLGCQIERTRVGGALLRAINHIGAELRENTEGVLRAALATFFFALFALGHVVLTPELETDNAAIPWLQAAIAAGMIFRRTMFLSALGIFVLFHFAIVNYGPFHIADYPIFLGAAIYLWLRSVDVELFTMRAIDVARWGAAITLMWASVEKWAYPQWTFPLFEEQPQLLLGFEPFFYMTTAGVVEFVLAFGLIWTPLVRRVSAVVLAAMFTAAILEFGRIDAIGHLVMIVMLLIFAADDEPKFDRRPLLAPALYGTALMATLAAYYGLHSLTFGSIIDFGEIPVLTKLDSL